MKFPDRALLINTQIHQESASKKSISRAAKPLAKMHLGQRGL
jgi:hypothetical protein